MNGLEISSWCEGGRVVAAVTAFFADDKDLLAPLLGKALSSLGFWGGDRRFLVL
jgi:hypothetical protein